MFSKIKIIAEAGVNHNGIFKNCLKLIDAANKAKADYVKFQAYNSENLVLLNAPLAKYQKKNLKKKISQYQLLKNYELKENDYKKLISYSKKKKIKILFSVFDEKSFNILIKLKVKDFKIPSGELDNYLLLKKIAQKAKKIFLSTGMSSINSIKKSFNFLIKNGIKKKNICVLHCTSSYPTKLENANILSLKHIKKEINSYIGFSDHTLGSEAAMASVVLGSRVIEKHLTLNNKMKGPDHKASIDPEKFCEFVEQIRKIELALGSEKKIITSSENLNIKYVKKCIVAKKNIKKNEKFSIKNLTSKRPMIGIPAHKIFQIIGKRAKKNFKENEIIKL